MAPAGRQPFGPCGSPVILRMAQTTVRTGPTSAGGDGTFPGPTYPLNMRTALRRTPESVAGARATFPLPGLLVNLGQVLEATTGCLLGRPGALRTRDASLARKLARSCVARETPAPRTSIRTRPASWESPRTASWAMRSRAGFAGPQPLCPARPPAVRSGLASIHRARRCRCPLRAPLPFASA